MASLNDVLANIPGYGAYIAKRNMNEQQPMQELGQAGALVSLMGNLQQQGMRTQETQRQEALRAKIAALPPEQRTRENVLPLLLEGTHDVKDIVPLLKSEGTAIGSGGLRLADGTIIPPSARPETTPKPPQTRNRISGEVQVQEEFEPKTGTWKEIGRGPRFSKQVTSINAPSQEPLSEEAIKDLAIQSLYDGNVLAGYRRDTTAMSRIANARVKLMKESGVNSEDVVSGRAGFKADAASLNKLTPQFDAITAFEQTAIRNGRILKELADKVDTTGVPVVERWIRGGRQATGDSDVAKFNAQMNLYRAEAARILTQPNLSGVLTDSARHEMESVLRNQASAKQVREVVDLLERDFGNRKATLAEQIGAIRTRMRARQGPGAGEALPGSPTANPAPGGGSPAPTAPSAAPSAFQEGQTATHPNGQKAIFKGGRWVPM